MSKQPRAVCPGCLAHQRDSLLCDVCLDNLTQSLAIIPPSPGRKASFVADELGMSYRVGRQQTLPWESDGWRGIEGELYVSFLRQGRHAPNVAGGRAGPPALPFDARARDGRADELTNSLHGWVRIVHAGNEELPADNLGSMASWLIDRRRRIRMHPAAGEMLAEITRLVGRCLAVIGTPPPQDYLGRCEVCGTDLYADKGADEVVCRRCKKVVTGIKARKEARLSAALDGLATRTEILATLPASFDLHVSQSRFSNWVTSGRLQARGRTRAPVDDPDGGYPTYRLRDVVELARQTRGRRKSASQIGG